MTIDKSALTTRRRVLVAAAGAAATSMAGSLALPAAAAAVDTPLLLNTDNVATATTSMDLDPASTDPVALSLHSPVDTLWVQSQTGTPINAHARALEAGVYSVSSGGGTGVLGASKDATNETTPGARAQTGVYGYADNSDAAIGVLGESPLGTGVSGHSVNTCGVSGHAVDGIGVRGVSDTFIGVRGVSTTLGGVWGSSDSGPGVEGGSKTGNGVQGYTDATAKAGVHGTAPVGRGVIGETTSGFGVVAKGGTGVALRVEGRATFTRSGRVRVAGGVTHADVTVAGGLPSGSIGFATFQGAQTGLAVAGVKLNVPSSGRMRIQFTRTTTAAIWLGWFVLG